MASKPLRLHPEAEKEYLAAVAWYRDQSTVAATEFQSAVRQAGETIRQAPQRWPFYLRNFQKYTLRQFPISIVYQEMLSEIVSLRHCSGEPETRLLERQDVRLAIQRAHGPPIATTGTRGRKEGKEKERRSRPHRFDF